jgi:hypothetical protein
MNICMIEKNDNYECYALFLTFLYVYGHPAHENEKKSKNRCVGCTTFTINTIDGLQQVERIEKELLSLSLSLCVCVWAPFLVCKLMIRLCLVTATTAYIYFLIDAASFVGNKRRESRARCCLLFACNNDGQQHDDCYSKWLTSLSSSFMLQFTDI